MNVRRNELAPISSYIDSGIPRELNKPARVSQAVFRRSDFQQANVAEAVAKRTTVLAKENTWIMTFSSQRRGQSVQ
jgi:hypothetical protein